MLRGLHGTRNTWPQFPGYAAAGEVISVGPDVSHVAAGDWVVSQAAHARYCVTHASACCRIPEGIQPIHAAAFTMATIAMQGVRRARIRVGESVAILGTGIIGNLAGQLAYIAGATTVVGVDPVRWRREVARQCRFTHLFQSSELQDGPKLPEHIARDGFDVVIEATGRPEPIVTAFQLARRRGRVVLLGSTRGITSEVDFYRDVHSKGLTIYGAHNGARPRFEDSDEMTIHLTDARVALELMQQRRLKIGALVGDVLPAGEAPTAYQRLLNGDEPLMTLGLDWNGL